MLLRLLGLSQGDGHVLDRNGKTGRGLSRGDQSPSFRFREQPPIEFVRRLQVMSGFGQTGHLADKAE
jgi:hypothetical protein